MNAIKISDELREITEQVPLLRQRPCYLVGGAVRDTLLGEESKDCDIEVYGVDLDELANALQVCGKIDLVGKSFGVVKLRVSDTLQYDFAIPRTDSKVGSGHRGFDIHFDPTLTPKVASARRDFTINAIMYDLHTGKLLDFWGGINDLQNKVLRHVSPAFSEDPLRVLRGMQFAGRFELTAAPETICFCREIFDSYRELPADRIREEWIKWAQKSVKPSCGILFLEQCGWIAHYPEIKRLRDCPQDPIWHPEGDVLTHSLLACDTLVRQDGWQELDKDTRTVLLLAMLCHDFGKPDTLTYEVMDGITRIRTKGHNMAGTPHVRAFLKNISLPNHLCRRVIPLVENHLLTLSCETYSDRAVRRLSVRLHPENIDHLLRIILADCHGRDGENIPQVKTLREKARLLNLGSATPQKLITGSDVIEMSKLTSGPTIGKILNIAWKTQLDGKFTTREEALQWLNHFLNARKKN